MIEELEKRLETVTGLIADEEKVANQLQIEYQLQTQTSFLLKNNKEIAPKRRRPSIETFDRVGKLQISNRNLLGRVEYMETRAGKEGVLVKRDSTTCGRFEEGWQRPINSRRTGRG
jgi:hypothetical protein